MSHREMFEDAKLEVNKMKLRNCQGRQEIEDGFIELERQLEQLKHFETSEEAKVKKWLTDTVGLPQYFRILISAGFDDLEGMKELNILKLGHKKKLIKAAKDLRGDDEFEPGSPS